MTDIQEQKETRQFSQIAVGSNKIKDPISAVSFYEKVNSSATKENVLTYLNKNNVKELRKISKFFFKTSGIYMRLCRYLASIYRFDYVVNPIIIDKNVNNDKIIKGFIDSLNYVENFQPRTNFSNITLKVIKNGAFYGYKVKTDTSIEFQELPLDYCRSRFFIKNKPVVEFNVKYFDDYFSDAEQRSKMLKLFPDEISSGYKRYRENKLKIDFRGDDRGWILLDVNNTVKFCINEDDSPFLVSVIPALIDLEEAKDIDRKRQLQDLYSLIIQKLPLDQNNEMVFDVNEAREIHEMATRMLGDAIGVDVLTTFADIDSVDLSNKEKTTSHDSLERVERAVFNEAGVSQMQFNTDGNLSLQRSIENDEATLLDLIKQYENFLNELLEPFNKSRKKYFFKALILETTIYNHNEMATAYKEQMMLGGSKFLPMVALGQSQLDVMATAYFENEVLNLNQLFVPPQMSSTVSNKDKGTSDTGGRPELDDSKKSEKTIQNKESQN